MSETTDLCNKVLDLVDAINHEQLIRLCDISLVIEKDILDCYPRLLWRYTVCDTGEYLQGRRTVGLYRLTSLWRYKIYTIC